mmetsp:Transcript_112266/g.198161  ORF Transcript_112266/g.198161 Transcript_112266/m.198161 type:complete len:214 (+) Transcript_112266:134-775(+)
MNSSFSWSDLPGWALRLTKKPSSWPFDFASSVICFFRTFGVASRNSSKSMTPFLSLSAFFMILSKSLSEVATKPSASNASFSSSRSKLPFPSLSAASNIRFSTAWPNLLSFVSTNLLITWECCLITWARIFCSSTGPITSRAPRTSGAKRPVNSASVSADGTFAFTFSSFCASGTVGFAFASGSACILVAGNRGPCPFCARSNVLRAEISRDC